MKIENTKVVLEATERAAEITSFKLKNLGWEAMWQGNPEFWAGRNPILFPIVGSTFDKIIHLDGQEYKMGNHGLLRSAVFTLENHTENSMTFSYSSNEETKTHYPFDFKVSVTYTLEEESVIAYDKQGFPIKEISFSKSAEYSTDNATVKLDDISYPPERFVYKSVPPPIIKKAKEIDYE